MWIVIFFVLGYAVAILVVRAWPTKKPRSVEKGRRKEQNFGNRIVRVLKAKTSGPAYVVTSTHYGWGSGYRIVVRHHSKKWVAPLTIVVDASRVAEKQLCIMNENGQHYHYLDDHGVRKIIEDVVNYMFAYNL